MSASIFKNKKKVSTVQKPANFLTDLKQNLTQIMKEQESVKTDKTTTKSMISVPTTVYPCAFCERTFTQHASLGGHVSRKHPARSTKFQEKQAKRELKTKDREMLKEAKELFRERTDKEPAAHRSKITQVKKLLITLEAADNTSDKSQLTEDLCKIFASVVDKH